MNRLRRASARTVTRSIAVAVVVGFSLTGCAGAATPNPKAPPGSTASSTSRAASRALKDESAQVLAWTPPAAMAKTEGKLVDRPMPQAATPRPRPRSSRSGRGMPRPSSPGSCPRRPTPRSRDSLSASPAGLGLTRPPCRPCGQEDLRRQHDDSPRQGLRHGLLRLLEVPDPCGPRPGTDDLGIPTAAGHRHIGLGADPELRARNRPRHPLAAHRGDSRNGDPQRGDSQRSNTPCSDTQRGDTL